MVWSTESVALAARLHVARKRTLVAAHQERPHASTAGSRLTMSPTASACRAMESNEISCGPMITPKAKPCPGWNEAGGHGLEQVDRADQHEHRHHQGDKVKRSETRSVDSYQRVNRLKPPSSKR